MKKEGNSTITLVMKNTRLKYYRKPLNTIRIIRKPWMLGRKRRLSVVVEDVIQIATNPDILARRGIRLG
jgi:hypothetical protein